MYKVYFVDGIRQGDYDTMETLEDPSLQLKDGNGQLYHLQDDPRHQLAFYRYSLYTKPVGSFEA
jgi:hypothetical protein